MLVLLARARETNYKSEGRPFPHQTPRFVQTAYRTALADVIVPHYAEGIVIDAESKGDTSLGEANEKDATRQDALAAATGN